MGQKVRGNIAEDENMKDKELIICTECGRQMVSNILSRDEPYYLVDRTVYDPPKSTGVCEGRTRRRKGGPRRSKAETRRDDKAKAELKASVRPYCSSCFHRRFWVE